MAEIVSFGEWVQKRRNQLRFTRKDFAQLVGCAPITIKKIERDERKPSKEMAELFAQHLQIPEAEQEDFMRRARGEFVTRFGLPEEMSLAEAQVEASDEEAPKHNLPPQTTTFVGRTSELAQIAFQLADPACNLLTILGAGGMGKTRIAIEVAKGQAESFTDGVTYVALTSVGNIQKEPKDLLNPVVVALADALKISFQGGTPSEQQITNYLKRKEMLIVFDNFEHLLDTAVFLSTLLAHAPDIKILTTSRERLNVQEEWLFPLKGLSFAEDDEQSAVQLFVQRARQVKPNFDLTLEAAAVKRICQLVEGMPLGLELAASWMLQLSCQEIADEIEAELDFLMTEARNVPDRHRSIRAIFSYSWEKLSEKEKDILQKISVFRGGFERKAAKAVAGASLLELGKFVGKSLLSVEENGRYQIHELLRQFANDKLASSPGGEKDARDQHAQFYLTFVAKQEANMRGAGYLNMLTGIDADINNIRTAIQWGIDRQPQLFNQSFCLVLWMFYFVNGWFLEGKTTFNRLATRFKPTTDPINLLSNRKSISPELLLWVQFNIWASMFQSFLSHHQQAIETLNHYAWLLSIDESAAAWTKALYLHTLGWHEYSLGNFESAKSHYKLALQLHEDTGDVWLAGQTFLTLSQLLYWNGENNQSVSTAEEGIRLLKPTGDEYIMSYLILQRGRSAIFRGEIEKAEAVMKQTLEKFSRLKSTSGICASLRDLGDIACMQGDFNKAKEFYDKSLQHAQEFDTPMLVNEGLWLLGNLAVAEGDFYRAKHYFLASSYQERGAWGGIGGPGWVALGLGEIAEAKRIFNISLKMLVDSGVKMSTLDALVGMAHVKSHTGNFEQALELLALVKHHQASSYAIKQKARKLWDELVAELPVELSAIAEARGRELDLFETAEKLLAEEDPE